MIEIKVADLSKVYQYTPIIKNFNFHFKAGGKYAIRGQNGSGKSTLVRLLSGYLSPSKGSIIYQSENKIIAKDQIYKYTSIVAPYASVSLDLTLLENLKLLQAFSKISNDLQYKDLLNILEWKDPNDKVVQYFSSGMQQKVNLTFALLSNSKLLLLDEPTSYLDHKAKMWYEGMLNQYATNRTLIIASNVEEDFYKPVTFIDM